MNNNLELPETLALAARQNGSWRWQRRSALCRYRGKWSGRANKWIWKRVEILSDKVTPKMVRDYMDKGIPYGGLHNKEVR